MILLSYRNSSAKEWICPIRLSPLNIKVLVCSHCFTLALLLENKSAFYIFPVALFIPDLEKERLPTPVFWPGEFHGLYRPWSRKELDMTEQRSFSLAFFWGGGVAVKFVLLTSILAFYPLLICF